MDMPHVISICRIDDHYYLDAMYHNHIKPIMERIFAPSFMYLTIITILPEYPIPPIPFAWAYHSC